MSAGAPPNRADSPMVLTLTVGDRTLEIDFLRLASWSIRDRVIDILYPLSTAMVRLCGAAEWLRAHAGEVGSRPYARFESDYRIEVGEIDRLFVEIGECVGTPASDGVGRTR